MMSAPFTVNLAASYVERLGWRIVPGHCLLDDTACSCRQVNCANPGIHPIISWFEAGDTGAHVRAMWRMYPRASVLAVPTNFEAVSVPASIGLDALDYLRKSRATCPVIDGRGRLTFLAQPGARDWLAALNTVGTAAEQIRWYGPKDFVPLPPTGRGTRGQFVWAGPDTTPLVSGEKGLAARPLVHGKQLTAALRFGFTAESRRTRLLTRAGELATVDDRD